MRVCASSLTRLLLHFEQPISQCVILDSCGQLRRSLLTQRYSDDALDCKIFKHRFFERKKMGMQLSAQSKCSGHLKTDFCCCCTDVSRCFVLCFLLLLLGGGEG